MEQNNEQNARILGMVEMICPRCHDVVRGQFLALQQWLRCPTCNRYLTLELRVMAGARPKVTVGYVNRWLGESRPSKKVSVAERAARTGALVDAKSLTIKELSLVAEAYTRSLESQEEKGG